MARRLSFTEFREALEQRLLPPEILGDYVEFDSDSPILRLIFRSDALLDNPPEDYDVDSAIYQFLQQLEIEETLQLEKLTFVAQKSVVADGDSWFNLPVFLRRVAIANWISLNRRFQMRNVARWGYTLKQILEEKRYITEIRDRRPDYFMLSGGGNDLQQGLANGAYIHQYDPNRPVDQYLTVDGEAALIEIGNNYRKLLNEVVSEFPSLKILTHGYDYPRPLVGGGKFIGKYLRQLGIPDNLMTPIMNDVLDKLNKIIKDVSDQYSTVHFLDCLNFTQRYTWFDDMHPSNDGFRALANKFEAEMNRI